MCTRSAKAPQFIGSCTWLPSAPSKKTHLFCVSRVYQRLLLPDIWALVDLVSSHRLSTVPLDSLWKPAPMWLSFPQNAILGLNNGCYDYVYFCFQMKSSMWEACGRQLMLHLWHQWGPHAPIGCFVSSNQTWGSVWILQIFARGTWLVKEACGGQPLHHIPFSAIPFPSNLPSHQSLPHPIQPHQKKKKKEVLSGRFDPHTILPQSNKVTKHPRPRNHQPSQPINTMDG